MRPTLVEALAEKATTIERCIARARRERGAASDFAIDFTRQDAALMNVQRACEASIDIANMVVTHEGLATPQTARDAFEALVERGIISASDAQALQRMVGFRNVAVHNYRQLDMAIVERVIDRELDTLARFGGTLLARYDRQA